MNASVLPREQALDELRAQIYDDIASVQYVIDREGIPKIFDCEIETPGLRYYKNIEKHHEEKINKIDLSYYEMSEVDAGRLFVDLSNEYFRYNTTNESWMIWTETHWTQDKWNLAERAAALITKIFQTSLADMNPSSLKEAASFIKKIRSASGVRSILFFASSDPRIVTSQEDYNADPDLLNTPGGTQELKTNSLREHRRSDLITKITAYTPDPNHKPVMFLKFLDQITMNREDLKESLQRRFGSGCSGRYPKDKVGVHHGDGQNGKTVLIEGVGDVLGDYAGSIDIKSLSVGEKQSSGHQDEIASLHNIRFCRSSESNQTIRLDESKIKKYTGADTIPVSFKHGHTFNMRPCFTLDILTNHKPRITGREKAIWRRIDLIPYEFTVPDEDKDPDYKLKMLKSDGSYIMHWLVEGARKWYESGFGNFKTTENATAKYKIEEDTIGLFVEDCCEKNNKLKVKASKLRVAYQKWCNDNGEFAISGRTWRQSLEEHGFKRKHEEDGKYWIGLNLTESEETCEIPF